MSVTTYTSCVRIERTDGYVLGLTQLDRDVIVDDSALGLTANEVTYLSAAGYTPTNLEATSDNSVNNADLEGVLTSVGVDRNDIIKGKYDFAKIHFFLWDYTKSPTLGLIKKLGAGHWGESTLKGGRYVAEYRSLSQQIQQTIGRAYNPECDATLGDTRCRGGVAPFGPNMNALLYSGSSEDEVSLDYIKSTSFTQPNGSWNTAKLTFHNGANDGLVRYVINYVNNTAYLNEPLVDYMVSGDTFDIELASYAVADDAFNTVYTNLVPTNDAYNGLSITFTSGPNNGLIRTITDYVGSTKAITLDTDVTANILTNDQYKIYATGWVAETLASKTVINDSGLDGTSYNGDYIVFKTGNNIGYFATISSSGAGTLTFSPAATNYIELGDKYDILDSTNTYNFLGTIDTVTNNLTFKCNDTTNPLIFAKATGWFDYGSIEILSGENSGYKGEVKTSTKNASDTTFKLQIPTPFLLSAGDTFLVKTGCDKRLSVCKAKFDNVINFQGFPYIPGTDAVNRFGGQ